MLQVSLKILLISLTLSNAIYDMSNITIIGQFLCEGRPMRNMKIALIDVDLYDPHDFLNETFTNQNGEFEIYGQEREFGGFDAELCVRHSCYRRRNARVIDSFILKSNEDLGNVITILHNFRRNDIPTDAKSCDRFV